MDVGSAIASRGTIDPAAPLTHVTGTTQINNITVPVQFAQSGFGGCLRLIPDGTFRTVQAETSQLHLQQLFQGLLKCVTTMQPPNANRAMEENHYLLMIMRLIKGKYFARDRSLGYCQ